MSEPSHPATRVSEVRPGLLHWTLHDDRIDARSDAWALVEPEGTVLVDPLPLTDEALAALGRVEAIVLTIQSHQRSAWRYRKRFGAKVHAPEGAQGLEEEPDAWYGDGASLPGRLRAIHAPGPCEASYALLRAGEDGVLFLGDLVVRGARGAFSFVPDAYQDDPARTRESVRRLLGLPVAVLCPGHGAPALKGGTAPLADALAGGEEK